MLTNAKNSAHTANAANRTHTQKKKKLPSKEESQTVKHKTILRKETKFVPKMFRKTKSSLCIKKELGYLDSNQERMNQNHLCCQLHHTPITRSIFYAYSSEKTSKRTPNRIWTGVTAVRGRCPRPLDDGGLTLHSGKCHSSDMLFQTKCHFSKAFSVIRYKPSVRIRL